jgi:hypothetical protein
MIGLCNSKGQKVIKVPNLQTVKNFNIKIFFEFK